MSLSLTGCLARPTVQFSPRQSSNGRLSPLSSSLRMRPCANISPASIHLPEPEGKLPWKEIAGGVVAAKGFAAGARRANPMKIQCVSGDEAAQALTTNDTPDFISIAVELETKEGVPNIVIGGMAGGSGMIDTNIMPAILGVVTTDAAVCSNIWTEIVRIAVNRSFGRIPMFGKGENNCVIALASGKSGSAEISSFDSVEALELQSCLDAVMQGLAKSVARNGKVPACLLEVTVNGANDEAGAATIARSVASSLGVQDVIHGKSSNWGTIASAAGSAGINFDVNKLDIYLEKIQLMKSGQQLDFDRCAAHNYLDNVHKIRGTAEIHITIGNGPGAKKAWVAVAICP